MEYLLFFLAIGGLLGDFFSPLVGANFTGADLLVGDDPLDDFDVAFFVVVVVSLLFIDFGFLSLATCCWLLTVDELVVSVLFVSLLNNKNKKFKRLVFFNLKMED